MSIEPLPEYAFPESQKTIIRQEYPDGTPCWYPKCGATAGVCPVCNRYKFQGKTKPLAHAMYPLEIYDEYLYVIDPGHGWLRVSIDELSAMGILGRISTYSFIDYKNPVWVYLEEDGDASLFIEAKNRTAQPFEQCKVINHHVHDFDWLPNITPYRTTLPR